jgi:hypothetical protein
VSFIDKEPKEADAEVPDTLTRLESIVKDEADAEAFPTVTPFPPRTFQVPLSMLIVPMETDAAPPLPPEPPALVPPSPPITVTSPEEVDAVPETVNAASPPAPPLPVPPVASPPFPPSTK